MKVPSVLKSNCPDVMEITVTCLVVENLEL